MEHKEVFFFCFALLQNDKSRLYLSVFCWTEVWECSKPLLNFFLTSTKLFFFFFPHHRHRTMSLETVTGAISAVPLAWKAAVLQWQERSSLNSATACYWLFCPLNSPSYWDILKMRQLISITLQNRIFWVNSIHFWQWWQPQCPVQQV